MDVHGQTVFRKTGDGRAAMAQRSHELAMATRSVLIMVNGVLPAAQLSPGGIAQATPHLVRLLELGLIEPVTPVSFAPGARKETPAAPGTAGTTARQAQPATVAAPFPGLTSAPGPAADAAPPAMPVEAAVPDALKRRAMARLQEHFGLDTPVVARALLAAITSADYNAALGAIEAKLAIYMGRRMAARTVQDLRCP